MAAERKRLGVAVAGLGAYGAEEIIPALQETKNCYLAGVVSGTEDKRKQFQERYGLDEKSCYSYERFDEISTNEDIDVVYIALPNSMHAEYTIRAARAGKHVICEKPMAMNIEECFRMMEAVQQAGVRFSMGYRLHFDPFNREMMRLGQQQVFGKVKNATLLDSMDIGEKNQWRLKQRLAGGGPLVNNGIYCVQAAIYIIGKLPVAVEAKFATVTDKEKFSEVEEGVHWTMYFDGDVRATCETSYSKNQNLMRAEAEKGWFQLEPAYEYSGLKGTTSEGPMQIEPINQQAAQLDDFARCIIESKETRVPAEMGLRDMEILAAIYESAKTGKRIGLKLEEYASLPEP